jgi:hypothetical protein
MISRWVEAKSYISTGLWRGYLPPEDFHHITYILHSLETWTSFWIATEELKEIPYHTQSIIRCMFLAELVIDSYQNTDIIPANFAVSLERDETDAFAIPIDAVYYPLELVAVSGVESAVVDDDDDSVHGEEYVDPPSSYQYLIDLVGDNRKLPFLNAALLRKPMISTKSSTFAFFEKVITGLKNYADHSFPFLQKVKKIEAPDYL